MEFNGELAEARKIERLVLGFGTETIELSFQKENSEIDGSSKAHQYHGECLRRVRERRVCEGCGKEVSPNEIVMARGEKSPEHEPYLSSEFEKYKYKRKCDMLGMIEIKDIPAEFINSVLTLFPSLEDTKKSATKLDEKKIKSFEKLLKIVENKAIVSKIVLRNRERNAVISRHPKYENLLRCYILNYTDEVRNFSELNNRVSEARKTIKLSPFEQGQINSILGLEVELNKEDLKDAQAELIAEFIKSKELKEAEKPKEEKEVLTEMIKALKEKKKETK